MIALNGYDIVLASGSPRRKAFLEELNIPFTVKTISVDETFPPGLKEKEIAIHIVTNKNHPFLKTVQPHQIIITADTIVWCENQYLGKPRNDTQARAMLQKLSGKPHQVITAVGFLTHTQLEIISETTTVHFKKLTNDEIDYYVANFSPFDKAGAYGIQDWIGTVGITKIEGSYTNVVGLPLAQVEEKIRLLVKQ
jgi:septum formation protein